MKSKSLYLILLLFSLYSISCSDNISLNIINNSVDSINVNSSELPLDITIGPHQNKIITIKDLKPSFILNITKKSIVKKYHFRDVDHWFPLTHNIIIIIEENSIILTGSRGERFYLEH